MDCHAPSLVTGTFSDGWVGIGIHWEREIDIYGANLTLPAVCPQERIAERAVSQDEAFVNGKRVLITLALVIPGPNIRLQRQGQHRDKKVLALSLHIADSEESLTVYPNQLGRPYKMFQGQNANAVEMSAWNILDAWSYWQEDVLDWSAAVIYDSVDDVFNNDVSGVQMTLSVPGKLFLDDNEIERFRMLYSQLPCVSGDN